MITKNETPEETAVLEAATMEFGSRGDVLAVRMGYVFEKGWITSKRALVVTVLQPQDVIELIPAGASPLPELFLGYPVEVSGPSLPELIFAKTGMATLETLDAVLLTGGRYFPPPDGVLKQVTARMKVNAHVSPEAGWKNLQKFLEATEKSLTVGMYDFGARHILQTIGLVAGKPAFDVLTLALQVGSNTGEGTKKDDLEDKDMVDNLHAQLGDKFRNAWVRVGEVNGWVPSSYHIKVAVRDSRAVSVSSGSWQSSNQPDVAALGNPEQSFLLQTYNRDWHVLVENTELAAAFEKYILHDFENNKATVLPQQSLFPEQKLYFLVPSGERLMVPGTDPTLRAFEPFQEDREFRVTPLLSPDNYFDVVLARIRLAEKELFIQNQTFNAPKAGQEKLRMLVEAVLEKQKEGVDVRIIFRNFIAAQARENLEGLLAMGFDPEKIRVHHKCHTKGIIADGRYLLTGSQNWSNDGVSVNRDASLLFDDEPLAAYFRTIFLHDWEKLASNDIGIESLSLELTTRDAPVPAGMVKVSWADIQELM